MKYFNLLFTIFLLVITSCKESKKDTVKNDSTNAGIDQYNVEQDSAIVFLYPTDNEIKKIKKERGEDNFYTIADDENFYQAKIEEILDLKNYKIVNTDKRFIKFNADVVFDKNSNENKWSVIIFKKGNKLEVTSSVELYQKLNKLNNIDYNSIIENKNLEQTSNAESGKNTVNKIKGLWRIDCKNELTTFDVDEKMSVYFSLYSNTIYINGILENSLDNEYVLKFKNIESQNDSSLKIDEKAYSKEKIIGKIKVEGSKLTFEWLGLYNIKDKRMEFTDDNIFVKENDNSKIITLTKCE
jgi:hypothetical protein